MSNELMLHCELNKDCFKSSEQAQIAYLLVEATSSNGEMKQRTPLNLCLVVDRSASMKGEKIENVKQAILNIIEHMNEEDYLSLVIFNEDAEVIVKSQPVSDKEMLIYNVNEITYSGGTSISQGMKAGLKELKKNLSDDRINRMIVLTDGQTYGDEEDCYELAGESGENGIRITALGVGDEWYEEVLDSIAERNAGKSDYIETAQDIVPIFIEEMEIMESIVTQNNTLRLRFVDGVVPRKICRVVPYIEEFEDAIFTENEIKVDLGELDKKQGQGVLVEVLLPPKQEGRYRISQAELQYEIPGKSNEQKSTKNDIVLHFSDDENSCKTVNPKVMNMAERVSAYNLQTRALQQAAVGDLPGATQKLKAAATRLLDLGEQELADTALQEVENIEQRGQMTSGGTKKLHYETRKLTQRLTI